MTRLTTRVVLAALAAVALLAGSGGRVVHAQTNGNVTINAFVEAALSGQGIRDLDFGRLIPGTMQTVAPNNTPSCTGCTSAQFRFINLLPAFFIFRRYARMTFTLPATLTHTSGASLTPSWGNAARACLEKNAVEYHCYPTWTPVSGVYHSLLINGAGSPPTPAGAGERNMNVYLGGTVNVPATQRAGVYNGTVTLTFTYAAF